MPVRCVWRAVRLPAVCDAAAAKREDGIGRLEYRLGLVQLPPMLRTGTILESIGSLSFSMLRDGLESLRLTVTDSFKRWR
jgi:hypothetical protein